MFDIGSKVTIIKKIPEHLDAAGKPLFLMAMPVGSTGVIVDRESYKTIFNTTEFFYHVQFPSGLIIQLTEKYFAITTLVDWHVPLERLETMERQVIPILRKTPSQINRDIEAMILELIDLRKNQQG